ncbi:CidA/LrgA family protein [Companilactobacillus metriopterae]|uniref:CidA/LrgA family protein n=1 Tax=Companilactobacillus metriopterae TaxID=1909267 RepID=UPI0013E99720|nr:CidA/LrgA family protein [Companilactobacillus metriopterae]
MKNEKESPNVEAKKEPSNILVQIFIYSGILFLSNILSHFMPASFPVPVPVWGLIILYVLLTTNVIKLHQVEQTSKFLIGIMGFLFVPSGIQMYKSLDFLANDGVKLMIAIIISTIVLLIVIAFTARILIAIGKKIRKEDSNDGVSE